MPSYDVSEPYNEVVFSVSESPIRFILSGSTPEWVNVWVCAKDLLNSFNKGGLDPRIEFSRILQITPNQSGVFKKFKLYKCKGNHPICLNIQYLMDKRHIISSYEDDIIALSTLNLLKHPLFNEIDVNATIVSLFKNEYTTNWYIEEKEEIYKEKLTSVMEEIVTDDELKAEVIMLTRELNQLELENKNLSARNRELVFKINEAHVLNSEYKSRLDEIAIELTGKLEEMAVEEVQRTPVISGEITMRDLLNFMKTENVKITICPR